MKRKRWAFVAAIMVVTAAVVYVLQNTAARGQGLAWLGAAPPENGWVASGFIEADEVSIAPELGGRIVALPVDEGAEVQAGDLLLGLQDDLLAAQVDLARARLEETQAALARLKAGARPETLARFQAQLTLAQAARDGARQAWLDAQAVRDTPQALDAQIAAARAEVAVAQQQFQSSLAQRDLAEQAWKDYGKGVDQLADVPVKYRPAMPTEFYLIPYQWEQALAATDAARAAYSGAQAALGHLLAQRSNPQAAQAQVNAAYARYQSAEAAVAQAQAALDGVKAGATSEQLAAAQAQVEVAQAALEAAQVQQSKASIYAPQSGVVVARSVYTGELAIPGVTALTLADLDHVTLTIYLPGQRLGQVALGQSIDVYVDAFQARAFLGRVVYISDQAEFTPRNVREPDQRTTLVYAVKLSIANLDNTLKPGMQAEARVKDAR